MLLDTSGFAMKHSILCQVKVLSWCQARDSLLLRVQGRWQACFLPKEDVHSEFAHVSHLPSSARAQARRTL
jgi:hypothetical protein